MAKRAAAEEAGLSFRTKDATSGGGTEGAQANIKEIEWVDEFTYGGRQKDKPQAALRVVFVIDGFDKPWEQHYTAGPSEKYEVIADGDGLKSASGKGTGLNKKCSAFRFMEELEKAVEASGLDIDDIMPDLAGGGSSVRELEGKDVILTNVKFETVGGDEKDMIVIAKFVDGDEDAKSSKPAKGKKGRPTGGDDLEADLEAIVVTLLAGQPSIKVGDLPTLVYNVDRKDANAKALMQLAMKTAFVSDEDRPWSFDAKRGVLKAAA